MEAVLEREREWVAVRSSDELSVRGGGVPPPRSAGVLALFGLLGVAVAFVGLAGLDRPDRRAAPSKTAAAPAASAERPEPSPVVLEGTSTYFPGQSSGWHSHPGLHDVLVLDGTLTVYDGACNRTVFSAGERYVGGDDVHLARNEADGMLHMTVTYIPNAGVEMHQFRIDKPTPAGCPFS